MDDPTIKEIIEKLKEKTPEVAEKVKEGLKAASERLKEMGLAALSRKEETELSTILAALPKTCEITNLERKGFWKKKLIITVECKEPEENL